MLDPIGSPAASTAPTPSPTVAPDPPPRGPDDRPTQTTPQQKTDAAYQDWRRAVDTLDADKKSRAGRADVPDAQAEVARTKRAFDDAVKAEISGDVAQAIQGVPPQYRTPEDKLIAQSANRIAARYPSDAAAQSEVKSAAADFQAQAKADALIPGYFGNFTAAEKLRGIDLTGQPPAVVDKVLANPLVQQWIQQAASDVGRPYESVPDAKIYYAQSQAEQASGNLVSATQGLSPQLATAVTRASMPTIQKIAALDLGGAGSMVPFDNVQSVLGKIAGSEGADGVVAQVADAYAANPQASGYLTYGGANSPLASSIEYSPDYGAAGNPAFAIALGDSLAARGQKAQAQAAYDAGAQGVHDYLANNGGSLLQAYDQAHQAAAEKDQHLASLLQASGPLTAEQRQAFIKAYRDDPANAAAYKADAEAAKRLSAYTDANQKNLIYAAGRNPAAAKQLYGTMKDLVQSGQGEGALKLMAAIKNDPAASAAFGRFSDYQGKFTQDAVASAQGQALVESGGDTKSAAQKMLELADPIFKGKEGWSEVRENYRLLANGETTAFSAAKLAEGYRELGAAGKGWAIASIMTSSFNGANSSDITGLINGFADAGASVDGLASGAVQALADAGKLGAYTESAEVLSKFGAKFLPGLGVVASGATFASDFSKAKDGNPAYALALFGDVMSSVGSVLEATGVGEVPGALVTGIGTALAAPFQLAGAIIDGNKERKEFQEEQVKYLQAAKVDDKAADILAKDGEQANLVGKQLNMSPEQVQALAVTHPELFDAAQGSTRGIVDTIRACGIQPGDVGSFLDALSADSRQKSGNPTEYADRLRSLYTSTTPLGPDQERVRADTLESTVLEGYPTAAKFVAQHAPGEVGAAADARRSADYQYSTALRTGTSSTASTGNLLKSNSNPAYQAQIVADMKQDGMLDNWVRDIATQYDYNGWPEAARTAIAAAENQGVLSSGEAQKYLAQLG